MNALALPAGSLFPAWVDPNGVSAGVRSRVKRWWEMLVVVASSAIQRGPTPAYRARRAGMGATTSQLIGVVGGTAGSTAASLTPLIFGAAAGPIGLAIGGAITAVTALLSAFGVGNGCGSTCVQASNDANQIEAQLKANLAAFQSGQLDQPTALSNAMQLWQELVQACTAIGGDAGKNCIADRQQGACKWKDASGQCWNWWTGYILPIQNAAPSAPSFSTILSNPLEMGLLLLVGGVIASEVL